MDSITSRCEKPWHSFENERFNKLFSATSYNLPGVPGGLHGCDWQKCQTQNPTGKQDECKGVAHFLTLPNWTHSYKVYQSKKRFKDFSNIAFLTEIICKTE